MLVRMWQYHIIHLLLVGCNWYSHCRKKSDMGLKNTKFETMYNSTTAPLA